MKTSAPASASSAVPAKPSGFVRSANAAFHGPEVVAAAWSAPVPVAADDRRARRAPSSMSVVATPAAPTPVTTTRTSSGRLPTSCSALRNAAVTTIAVPCWSSWKTGMSSSSFSRLSISKQRGAEMSSRLMPPKPGAIAATAATISSDVGRREADRPGVDAAELLEQHRLALHHRHRRLGADVAEAEHGRAVADDGDGVLLDRQVPDLAHVLGDRDADARDAGRVGHREVVARLQRRLRRHLDLAAEVEQERPVGDVLDLDARERVDGGDDLLDVVGARGVDRDVADLLALLDADEVDRAEAAAGVADRAGDARRTRPGRSSRWTRSVALNEAEGRTALTRAIVAETVPVVPIRRAVPAGPQQAEELHELLRREGDAAVRRVAELGVDEDRRAAAGHRGCVLYSRNARWT